MYHKEREDIVLQSNYHNSHTYNSHIVPYFNHGIAVMLSYFLTCQSTASYEGLQNITNQEQAQCPTFLDLFLLTWSSCCRTRV